MALRPYKSEPLLRRPSISVLSSIDEESGEERVPESMALSIANAPQRSVTRHTTRREYALLELLRSERTYVRDLVLLRDYQIPLASGRLSSMSSIWSAVDAAICQYLGLGIAPSDTDADPVPLAGSSSAGPRPLTVKSKVSAISFGSIFTVRPMKTKDVNIVFNNIQELAAFSEDFLYQLESALGGLIEGNEGEDSVGRLFLNSLPKIESLYETYIMNQPHALEHYRRLSQTFQFDVYLPKSQILAHKSSNAWDLPSLLIKPLLAAIIAETPDSHGDIAHLIKAYARMAEMTCGLNERRHEQQSQRKVVRDVLAGAGLVVPPPAGPTNSDDAPRTRTRKKSGFKFGLSGDCSIPPRPEADPVKDVEVAKMDAVAQAIKAGGERLRDYEAFMAAFTKEAADWADAMRDLVGGLEELVHGFARVLPMDYDSEGDSLVGALKLLEVLINDLWRLAGDRLRAEIDEDLVRTVQSLKETIAPPLCLVEEMQRLEPLYCDVLISLAEPWLHRPHPPPSLFEASASYISLRKQLSEELPTYLALLDKRIAACILKFAHIQGRLYRDVRDLWMEFREAVKMPDWKTDDGAREMIRIWSRRCSQVHKQLMCLRIARPLGDVPVTVVSNSPRSGDLDGDPDRSNTYETSTRRGRSRAASESLPTHFPLGPSQSPESSAPHQEDDVFLVPVLYECRVLRPYQAPDSVTYRDLPFFTLVVGEVYEVLVEAGHPSTHPDLPLHVDEGEDCLLLARHRRTRVVAWALASFVLPLNKRIFPHALSLERGLPPTL